MDKLHVLPAGHTITATIIDGSGFLRQVDDPSIGSRVTNSAPVTFGPYGVERRFTSQGQVTVAIAVAETLPTVGQKAMLDNISTTDPADDGVTIWADEGVLKVSGPSA